MELRRAHTKFGETNGTAYTKVQIWEQREVSYDTASRLAGGGGWGPEGGGGLEQISEEGKGR